MATQISGIIEQVQPKGSSGTKYAIASTAYGYCQTAANKKEKIVDMTGFKLIKGVTIHVKFQYNNTVASPTLNVMGTGALNIVQYGTTAVGTTDETTSWYAGAVVSFTYDGTSWVRDQGFNSNTIPSAYCTDADATKTASCTNYALLNNSWIHVLLTTNNTAQSALTLNINGKGAKPIFINGAASSSSNCALNAGSYLVFYDGTNYQFRTDGKLPGDIAGDAMTINGHTVEKDVPSDAVFTDHYDWDDITNIPSTATSWPKWNQILAGAEDLSEGSSNVTDNTEILTSYASNNGFADTNAKGVVYRRDAIKLYNYINSKLGTMAHESKEDYAKLDSAAFTGAVTVQAPTDDTNPATKEYVDDQISASFAANNAMVYKGVRAGADTSSSNAYGALTPAANCGDTYKVSTAGFINGLRVEVGDMLICTTNNTAEATSSNYTTVRNNWNIIQTSEGTVSSSSTSSTNNALAIWDSTSGRIIKNQSYITYLDHANVVRPGETATIAVQDGLRIVGTGYGDAAQLLANADGATGYGDGGPQIQFSTSASNQDGAIIFTHYNNTSGMPESFQFVGQSAVAVRADGLIAKTRAIIGEKKVNSSYTLDVEGATYINGATTITNQLKFTNTDAIKHIEFTRTTSDNGPSYICYPETGLLAIGFATGYDNSIAVFDQKTALRPGKTNTYNLGASNAEWAHVYTPVLAAGSDSLIVQVGTNSTTFTVAKFEGSSFLPGTTSARYIGSTSNPWANVISSIITAGTRYTTTAPTTEQSVDRIIITPYYHTGGPWKIASADNNTTAFLKLMYGNTELLKISSGGVFTKLSATGPNTFTNGFVSHVCDAGSGTGGYFKFLTLTVTATYRNRGIQISYSGRGRLGGIIYLRFANQNGTDPALTVQYTGDATIYYIKTATSTWDLYINKSEAHDNEYFTIINPSQIVHGGVTWAWQNATVETLPEGYLTAEIHSTQLNITGNADSASTISATGGSAAKFWRGDNTWSDTISGGLLRITNNSNTVIIGSQNTSYTHIYNSADIPFIFNKAVMVTNSQGLGSTTYPWGSIYNKGYNYHYANNSQYISTVYANAAQTAVGEFFYDVGHKTNIAKGQFGLIEWAPKSTADTGTSGHYERYLFPAATAGLTENKEYNIITTKNLSDISGTYKTLGTPQFYGSENTSKFFSNRADATKENGWAWSIWGAYKADKTSVLASMSVLGAAGELTYVYLNANSGTTALAHSSDGHIRFYPATAATINEGMRLATPKLTVGQYSAQGDGSKLYVAGSTTIVGPLRVGASDVASNTGYVTANVGANNYIAFYGVYGDRPGEYNHAYIGESIYGPKDTSNEKSELLLFKGNDINNSSGPDRIRLFASQVDIQVYESALFGTWDAIRSATGTQVANFAKGKVTINGEVDASNFNGKLLATHTANDSQEVRVIYGSTIDYWWGVGTANENHGLYDDIVNKWILSAGADNNWTFVGNVTGNADTATTATKISYQAQLTTQEAIDNFLEAKVFKIATFKTSSTNNIGMASNDGIILSIPWTSTTYGAQLAFDDNTAGTMKFRGKSSSWGDWKTVLHSGNSYAANSNGTAVTVTCGSDATIATINDVAIKINVTKPSYTYSEVGAAPSSTVSCTAANVKAALGTNTSTTNKWLNQKGEWSAPTASQVGALASSTTVTNVSFTGATDDAEYPILMKNSTGSTTTAAGVKFANTSGKSVTINPSTGTITAAEFSGSLDGNASSASKVTAKVDYTKKSYVLGTQDAISTTSSNVSLTGGTGVYLTTTPGELSAYRYSWHYGANEHAYTLWNDTDQSIDFVFV